jgi:hypothetical protein
MRGFVVPCGVGPGALAGEEREMGLYERLLEERACEEAMGNEPVSAWEKSQRVGAYIKRRGWQKFPKPGLYGGYVTKQELAEELDRDRSRYTSDLARFSGLIERGVHSMGSAYVFHHLKKKYPKEYLRLKDEHQGQRELL